MAVGAVVQMALSPLLALGAYRLLRPVSEALALAAGAVLMLALALLAGRPRRVQA